MKLIKLGLRFWIGLTSVSSFLGGWVLLAHSPKPVQSGSPASASTILTTPLPTLAPLAPIQKFSGNNGSILQNVPVIVPPTAPPPSNFVPQQPVFTTGGS